MRNNLLSNGELLSSDGNLNEAGYAFSLIKKYNKENIKVSKLKIKEWDYYYIGDKEYGIALTIDDNGYMGLVSFSILDFKNKEYKNFSSMYPFPKGNVNLPLTSKEGISKKDTKNASFKFEVKDGVRTLTCKMLTKEKREFECNFVLHETTPNSMVIATPFLKKKHFYYNQKINLLNGEGYFKYGYIEHKFNNVYGVLDWGRGVWTYKNTWYWSSLSYEDENHNRIGFNLGYGFGDTSKASENMLFVNKKAYKFDDCIFDIPKDKNNKEIYLNKWKIYSNNKDIDLEFTPLIDRHDKADVLIIAQDAHQVFGLFNGKFKTNDGEIIIKDALGFAEKVKNRW